MKSRELLISSVILSFSGITVPQEVNNSGKNNSIQFNSIFVYLRANLTAQKPVTKLARIRRNNNKTFTNKIQ
jgi:hypothetical protein